MQSRNFEVWIKAAMIALLLGLLFAGGRACRTEIDSHCTRRCSKCLTYQEMFALQEEAKTNLEAIYVAELTYFSNSNTYAPTFKQIGWNPQPEYRYAYFLADDVIQPDPGGPYQLPAGLTSTVTQTNFTAFAVGNIDCDDVLDIWMIYDFHHLENPVNDVLE